MTIESFFISNVTFAGPPKNPMSPWAKRSGVEVYRYGSWQEFWDGVRVWFSGGSGV